MDNMNVGFGNGCACKNSKLSLGVCVMRWRSRPQLLADWVLDVDSLGLNGMVVHGEVAQFPAELCGVV